MIPRPKEPEAPLYMTPRETSRAAKEANEPHAPTQRASIVELLKAHPEGLTDEQMQDELKMNPSTQRPRRGELVADGVVCERRKVVDGWLSVNVRPTRSGRMATVWILNQSQGSDT